MAKHSNLSPAEAERRGQCGNFGGRHVHVTGRPCGGTGRN
jgi:hypothetical protein